MSKLTKFEYNSTKFRIPLSLWKFRGQIHTGAFKFALKQNDTKCAHLPVYYSIHMYNNNSRAYRLSDDRLAGLPRVAARRAREHSKVTVHSLKIFFTTRAHMPKPYSLRLVPISTHPQLAGFGIHHTGTAHSIPNAPEAARRFFLTQHV